MKLNIKNLIFLFLVGCFILNLWACKSKKLAANNSSYQKPKSSIANKYAEKMEVNKSDINNGNLYQFINDWEGVKYKMGGLDKNGIDCSGFVYTLYKEVYGRNIPRNTNALINVLKRKYENELVEGDLVFFDYDGKKYSHVGVYLQNGYYVHASTRKGVLVMKLKDPYTYKYFSRCGEIKN
ncbi:MAG: glycoside hydrolase [Sphingobacteriales bacterium]|nr:MAG: glycoside hydrolase [Sphingobacteriales bacterium]